VRRVRGKGLFHFPSHGVDDGQHVVVRALPLQRIAIYRYIYIYIDIDGTHVPQPWKRDRRRTMTTTTTTTTKKKGHHADQRVGRGRQRYL
jgi:hypothetical protein